ncbi:MAG: type II secretion system GspH family protein, partial [Terrimicrobiaceae bacterium]|nr:type II secretion system GspH family protein [Terrimicrobiaceae bacterium]
MGLPRTREAYTLLEVLLALGVVAVLLGITIPYFADSFGKTPGEEASEEIAKAVQGVRNSALEKGETRQMGISENGLQIDPVKAVKLPA